MVGVSHIAVLGCRTPMILRTPLRLVDGLPWGLGAATVVMRPKGWTCPRCSTRYRREVGMHVYQDGDVACTACARQWVEQNYMPTPRRKAGQSRLF